MTQPKHTHPLGYLEHTAKQLREYWFLILLALWQWDGLSTGSRGLVISAILVWLFVWPLLKWLTLTYQLTPEAIVINSGIFVRHHRHIPYTRLQTVQRKQWFYFRPFHLETLLLETASHQDNEPEVKLPAVPTTVADAIDDYRHADPAATSAPAAAEPAPDLTTTAPLIEPTHTYVIDRHALSLFGLTSTGIIPLLLVLLGLYGKMPHTWTDWLLADASHLALPLIIGGALVLLMVAFIGAYLWVLIRYYHFTLTRTADQLQIAKGLFQRNTIAAPLARIQAVRCKQNVLRQWLHLQTIQVLLASKAASDDDNNDLVILPAIAQPDLYAVLSPFIDWVPTTGPDLTALRVPQAAHWLLWRNALLVVVLPVALLCWLWQPWGWFSLVFLIIAGLQGQFAAHNTDGARLNDQLLVLQTGHVWTRETFFVRREQIQSLRVAYSVWMRPKHLAHLTVNVRHGNHNQAIELRYVNAEQVQRLYDWYRQD